MNGTIGMEGNINIMHEAYLLDDPFVIDDLRSQFLDLINQTTLFDQEIF